MLDLKKIEITGTAAVKRLRIKKLQSGYPFMINSRELPGNQCYLEYPDGSIKLVTIKKSSRDFTIIRELTQQEKKTLRAKYKLLDT